jgi:uncharacterized protein YhaN
MRILSLEVENYGVFARRRLDFGDGRLVLIYGPNEAGKTTLLQLLRETVYGFPHRNSLPGSGGSPHVSAVIELRNGRRLNWIRRKGRGATLTGQFLDSQETLDEAACLALLEGAGPEMFRHVFAFSLQELQAGEKSLAEARLTDALYGGGLGGLPEFQWMQKRLLDRQKELFVSRGSKPVINQLIRDIRDRQEKLRVAAVKPGQFAEWDQQWSDEEQNCERLRRELDAVRKQLAWLDQHRRSFPRRQRLAELSDAMTRCDLPPELTPANLTEIVRKLERLHALDRELQEMQQERQQQELRRAAMSRAHPALLSERDAVQAHYQDLRRIASCRRDMPLRLQEAETSEQYIVRRLEKWRPDWGLDFLAAYPFGQAELQVLRGRVAERETLARDQAAAAAVLSDLQQRILETEQRLAAQAPPFPQELAELLEQAGASYEASLEEARRCLRELATQQAAIDRLDQRSQEMLQQSTRPAESSRLPDRTRLEEARTERASIEQRLDRCRQQIHDIEQQLRDCTTKLASLVDRGVPSTRDLPDARSLRDQRWQELREYLEPKNRQTSLPAPNAETLREYEQAVAACDELSDQILAQADLVVRRDQLSAEESGLRARHQQAGEEWQRLRRHLQQFDERWRELWRPLAIDPLSPEAMLDWLRLAHERLAAVADRDELAARMDACREQCRQFERRLAAAGGRLVEGRTMALARAQIAAARQDQALREQLSQQVQAWRQQAAKCLARSAEFELRQKQWEQSWSQTLQGLHLPGHWEPALAQEVLAELLELKARWRDAQTLRRRAADMHCDVQRFETDVAALLGRVAVDLAEALAEQAVAELQRRLVEELSTARVDREIEERLRQLADRRAAAENQRQQLVNELHRLGTPADVFATEGSVELLQRLQSAAAIQDEMRRLRELPAEGQAPPPHAWKPDDPRLADADACAAEISAAQTRLEQVERDYREALKRSGSLKKKLDDLAHQHAAADAALELERSRAVLVSAVDQWAPVVLAEALMQRCLANFEESLQPQILKQVTHLFDRLTNGRYISIRRQLDEQGKLRVEQCDGQWKEPGELSTGTREQLYLAIRLAYVMQYCRDCEPLPIVMDDVLVNFDERRVQNTVDVLREVSQSVPLMLMTCHAPTARAVLNIAPEATHLDLAEPLMFEATESSIATSKRRSRKPGSAGSEAQPSLFPPGG